MVNAELNILQCFHTDGQTSKIKSYSCVSYMSLGRTKLILLKLFLLVYMLLYDTNSFPYFRLQYYFAHYNYNFLNILSEFLSPTPI